jgi:hypothetical protein
MLDVTYEATGDLPPGRLVRIDEDRGTIRVHLDRAAPLAAVVHQLNIEVREIMQCGHWFQLWKDEIVSCHTPNRPLRVEYVLERKDDYSVYLEERKGFLSFFVDPDLDAEQFASVMNPITRQHLDGGQWFQLFDGDIIDNSPEPMSQV